MNTYDPSFPVDNAVAYADELRAQLNALNNQDTATNQRIDNLPPPVPGPKGDKGDPGESIVGPPGSQGPAGNDGARGPVGPGYNMCGAWVAGQNYNAGDAVSFNGLQYAAQTTIMSPWTQPDTNPEWLQVSIVGPQGEAGGMNFPVTTDAVFQARVMIQQSELHITTNPDTGSGESAAFIAATDHGAGPVVQIGARASGADTFRHDLDLANGVQHGDIPQFDDASKAWRPTRGVTQDIMVPRLEGGYTILHFVSGLLMSTEIGA